MSSITVMPPKRTAVGRISRERSRAAIVLFSIFVKTGFIFKEFSFELGKLIRISRNIK